MLDTVSCVDSFKCLCLVEAKSWKEVTSLHFESSVIGEFKLCLASLRGPYRRNKVGLGRDVGVSYVRHYGDS